MAGDVYSQEPYVGRGGWSWYTGAAGWMHQAAIGSIFGLKQTGKSLRFEPCLPTQWKEVSMTLVRGQQRLEFTLLRFTSESPLDEARTRGAQLLYPGVELEWQAQTTGSCFVIPLIATSDFSVQ